MGALRLVGHSAPGVPAAHVTRPLPLAARDGALKDTDAIQPVRGFLPTCTHQDPFVCETSSRVLRADRLSPAYLPWLHTSVEMQGAECIMRADSKAWY